ncbi:MAG: AbiH family protein [Lachnospiraceae bacterium]|jgi:hypothetical protein
MNTQLFIIGNGFDLAHDIPSRFSPDFKEIADEYDSDNFWELYQTHVDDIWSDFENLLGRPDFNSIEEIFESYTPDYMSDRESDRDAIIWQVDLNGNLNQALEAFADNAELYLSNVVPQEFFKQLLKKDAYYLTFNYTHTLEKIYGISKRHILHIHGEVGKETLELGYPKGHFFPDAYDDQLTGRMYRGESAIKEYISRIDDYYIRTAYEDLFEKCKSFYKDSRVNLLSDFLQHNNCKIKEITVFGHSCAIDFDYFKYLVSEFPDASWVFYVKGDEQRMNVQALIGSYAIQNNTIKCLLDDD